MSLQTRRVSFSAVTLLCAGCLFPSLDGLSGGDAGAPNDAAVDEGGTDDANAPGTVTFAAVADTWVRSGSSVSSNKGTDPTLYSTALDSGGAERRIFLKFDVNGLGGRKVRTATLRLACERGSDEAGTVYFVADTNWSELAIDWNSQPALQEPPLATGGAINAGAVAEFNVTSAIAGEGLVSFALKSSGTNEVRYSSKEGTGAPPALVVSF